MTRILTHRGLDPSRTPYFAESSREAFTDQIRRGFGLEVDIAPTLDGFVLCHDQDLSRATKGRRTETISGVPTAELESLDLGNGHFISLESLLALSKSQENQLLALHVKARVQDPAILDRLAHTLAHANLDKESFFLFDLLPESAAYLSRTSPSLPLGASVAHPHDVQQYGTSVGNTLMTLERVVQLKEIYDWVVLDEWNRMGADGRKTLHTPETYSACRAAGFRIMSISPELHATSPGLYGGEEHEDAENHDVLSLRMTELLSFDPDAYCTDYPDLAAARMM